MVKGGKYVEKIIHFTDTIVIGFFLNASAVTFYAIAGSLTQYVQKIVRSFAHLLTPLFSELDETKETKKTNC